MTKPNAKPSEVIEGWRNVPLHALGPASKISAQSPATLYKAASEGRLEFVRLGGRTLVKTESLIRYLETAEPWTPSERGKEARAKRRERAQAAWQE